MVTDIYKLPMLLIRLHTISFYTVSRAGHCIDRRKELSSLGRYNMEDLPRIQLQGYGELLATGRCE
jgi:hypothetical protein